MTQRTPGTDTRSRLWDLLQHATGWLSGERVSEQLGVSRAAIAKHIAVLRREGHEIEAVPHRGYRLTATAERFTEQTLRPLLHTHTLGQAQEWLDEAGSTNSIAALRALEGGPHGLLIVAQKQLAGRGRRGHVWFSAPESLAFSLLLRPHKPLDAQALTHLALESVQQAITTETGLQTQRKEPNDLLFEGRKLSGILVETGYQGDVQDWIALGIGVNVNAPSTAFSGALAALAVSLRLACGHPVSRARLLAHILNNLEEKLTQA